MRLILLLLLLSGCESLIEPIDKEPLTKETPAVQRYTIMIPLMGVSEPIGVPKETEVEETPVLEHIGAVPSIRWENER